ncbi:CPBP family intramembrane metalloprotease [Maribacter litopenaei]|uniref:CPBP family intramembrane metalloprotease n=1 Tax=Maribacter litopenaei TaxID=2976127 RepID=A0ABY5YB61_9FLAO|nr:CPBP family intramembrane glutamic endopeptidase [Maribacter litopenaei]UWX56292.1 CPBP family intramembrane metalloprotease [Maribacter litopenaei]
MLEEIIQFLNKPLYKEEDSFTAGEKLKFILKLAVLAISASVVLSILIGLIETLFNLDLGKHAMDDFLENYPAIYLLLFAVIGAPVMEELLFRGPMIWFKHSKLFPFIFYLLTLGFGFMHITNYELNLQNIILSPILVAPQLAAGILLGFTRVKFGLIFSILLHALYNLILADPIFMFKILDIPIE